jgi:hypothetical protein
MSTLAHHDLDGQQCLSYSPWYLVFALLPFARRAAAVPSARDAGQSAVKHRIAICLFLVASGLQAGCGTTKWTDTRRTATEQLLISDAVDGAVQKINFRRLRGRDVYLDDSFLTGIVDQDYLVSSLRQHLLASGCILKGNREEATYIVEARAGAVGTDRHDLLYGVPATTIPTFMPIPGMPTSIPEIPLVKRTDQIGVAKLAVFAYHRESGLPFWQSGLASETSKAKDIWILGAGPFQKGTIYEGFVFAGEKIEITNPLVRRTPDVDGEGIKDVNVTQEEMFDDPLTAITMQPLPTSAAPMAAAPPVTAPPAAARPVAAPPAGATGPALTPPATPGQGTPPRGFIALPTAPSARPPAVSRIPLPTGTPGTR